MSYGVKQRDQRGQGEEKNYLETNKKGNITYQNLCVNTKVENVCVSKN